MAGGTKFERHASQVIFDPVARDFVVTWSKCNVPDADRLLKRAPASWIPSVSSIVTLYERGMIPSEQIVFAARAIGRAWLAGDRDELDTEGAKKAAELVHDLSSMCVDSSSNSVAMDIGQAMRHLSDEISAVRFSNVDAADFEDEKVLPAISAAASECLGIPGFLSWPPGSKRRRFMFCLNKTERTPVVYSIVALIFDCGACPLLSLSDMRALRMRARSFAPIDRQMDADTILSFASYALGAMREARNSGLSKIGNPITQQELADILSDESSTNTKKEN